MSTTLYNSYKLPKMDLPEFFSMVDTLKKEIHLAQTEVYKTMFVNKCLKIYDNKTIYPDSQVVFKESPYKDELMTTKRVVSYWFEKNQSTKKKNEKMDDLYFHVNFLFYKNRIYAVARSMPQQHEFTKVFEKITKAESYEYWNNTDQPKGITRSQWNAREKEWDKVFGNRSWSFDKSNSVKVDCPFDIAMESFDIKNYVLSQDQLMSDQRLNRFAEQIALNAHLEVNPDLFKGNSTVEYMSYITSDEFHAERKKQLALLKEKVRYDITIEDVLKEEHMVIRETRKQRTDYILIISNW